VRWILWLWTRGFVLGAWAILGVRYRLEGLGNVPGERPVIFACNHQSYWESIFLCSRIRDVNVITKRGAMEIPVFGWGLKHAPMIPVDRDQPGRNLRRILRDGPASLAAGRDLLIFPEGTRVPPGQRRPYLRGVELLYRKCGVPVVPIVQNAGLLWPPGFGVKRPGTVTVRFLEPIPPGLGAAEFAERLERLLNEEKDRLPGITPAHAAPAPAEVAPVPSMERPRAVRAG
jgi:1-acyl-sn-glycerol-3-phosphate acyltransferase